MTGEDGVDGAAIETMDLPHFDLAEFVRRVLAEDLGSGGDVTSKATIDANAHFTADMNCREPIVVAGLEIAIAFFRTCDREVRIERLVKDGEAVPAGAVLLRLEGNARAMLAARADPNGIDEEHFADHLYTAGQPDVDLLIRTGGDQRTSNFLLWQAAYAELVFCAKFWPDFTADDLDAALTEYERRDRRFGG